MAAKVPEVLDLAKWTIATREEVVAMYQPGRPKKKGAWLAIRKSLRPIDLYCYLRARFGQPNGLQTFLRKDDSDNIFHWDYNIKCNGVDVHIAATSREMYFAISEKLSDEDWKALILALKKDFGKFGKEKGAVQHSLEKWVVFQNKFALLADLCADLHSNISNLAPVGDLFEQITKERNTKRYATLQKKLSKRAVDLYGDCLKLKLLTPVMAEAFINHLILIFCKDEIRADKEKYDAFIREKIPERLALLSTNCKGFAKPIGQTGEPYSSFKRVMDKRNFAIHGNVDPVREQIETVYFEGKMPIFVNNGDHILSFFTQQELIADPAQTLADYEAVHLFLAEVMDCLDLRSLEYMRVLSEDPYPGYEVNMKRVTKILPGHNVATRFKGMRFDDDLKVKW